MSLIRKIHYCWYGGKKPPVIERNIAEWGRLNPHYELCEWNEGNLDIAGFPFALKAIEERRWAFVADVVRLQALQDEGGFYADVDVRFLRPLDTLPDQGDKLVLGYMYPCALGTAVIYSPPGHPYIKGILERCKRINPQNIPVNNSVFTEYFINEVPGFLLNGKEWQNDICHLYPREFFEQPAFIRNRGMAIHFCGGSWNKAFQGYRSCQENHSWARHTLLWLKRKLRTWRAARNNEFTDCYRAACQGKRLPYNADRYYL